MTTETDNKGQVGFYGKLPMVGDFISRRLPNEFIVPWDNWLQRAMAASREEIGEDWLNSYLTSPIWRFLLSPGVCGNKAVAGIIMPSVDRVGRYYPLTVALLLDAPPTLPSVFTGANAWFEQLEDAALTGLEGGLDINGFDKLVQSIPTVRLPASLSLGSPSDFENQAFYTHMDSSVNKADAFVGRNAQLLENLIPGHSLWSNAGFERTQAALLACEGLPPISRFSAFLKGIVDSKDEAVSRKVSSKPIIIEAVLPTAEPEREHLSLSSILGSNSPNLSGACWRSWAITDTGKRRKYNEDALLNRPDAGLWAVADGMGGHKAGDVASQWVVDALDSLTPIEPLESYVQEIKTCLQLANSQLRQLGDREYDNQLVGSTVVVLVCRSGQCTFLWVGDSRLYRFRDNQLQQLTQDHCGVDEGPGADTVKKNNIITRAMGAYDDLDLDRGTGDVRDGDIFLLCSDGLDKEMSFKDIEQAIKTCRSQDIAQALVNETLARGGRDNVSVIVVVIDNAVP